MIYLDLFLHENLSHYELFEHIHELPLFSSLPDKAMYKPSKRKIRLCYVNTNFVGYIIYYYKDKRVFINDIEVKKSIREDKNKPRYGEIILNQFIRDMETKYSYIILQAINDDLVEYFKRFGFELAGHDREMILKFNKNTIIL